MTSVIRLGSLALLAGGLLLARPVAAGEGDALKETQERLRVEAQRLELLVSDALDRSDKIGKSNPMRAVEILREAKTQIEADKEALKPERRESLSRKIVLALRAWGERADNPLITAGPTRPVTPRSNPADEEARRSKEEAARRINDYKSAVASGKEINRQMADGFYQTYNSVLKSSIPEHRDMTFPADWVEKSKRRSQMIKLTEEEKKIVKALNTPLPIEMEGRTFKDVLDFIREKSGVAIVVDQRALDDLNITYASMINVNLGKVTMRTVLKRVLGDLNLTYVMKDGAIQVTTPARAKEMLTTRVYSVADLMPAADMRMPAFVGQAQAYQTLQMLVVLITQTVEPDSWEVNGKGGLGTIQFDPIRFSLIVKQTAEMHYLMGLAAGMR